MRYIFIARRRGNFFLDCEQDWIEEIFHIKNNLTKDELIKIWASFLVIYLDELIKNNNSRSEDRRIEFYIYENGLQIWNNNQPISSYMNNFELHSSQEEFEMYNKDYIEYTIKIYKEAIDLATDLLENKFGTKILNVLYILKKNILLI